MKNLQLLFCTLALFVFLACTKDKQNKNYINPQLLGHWKFTGFINVSSDTTLISLHSDCDSCMSLFISSPNKYFGRSYQNGITTTAYTNNNKLVLSQTQSDGFPEGDVELKFFAGIHNPSTWEIKNNYLLLTTSEYSDTLLFIAK